MYQRKAKYLFQLSERANNHLGEKDTSLLNLKRSSLITEGSNKYIHMVSLPFSGKLVINFFSSFSSFFFLLLFFIDLMRCGC